MQGMVFCLIGPIVKTGQRHSDPISVGSHVMHVGDITA